MITTEQQQYLFLEWCKKQDKQQEEKHNGSALPQPLIANPVGNGPGKPIPPITEAKAIECPGLFPIQEPEKEETDFQEWMKAKKQALSNLATNETLFDGFKVSVPRKSARILKTSLDIEIASNLHKDNYVRLECLSKPSERLVIGDIDHVPSGISSWEQLRGMLTLAFSGKALVIPSVHGKAKVIFRIQGQPSKDEVRRFLKNQFSILGNLWEETVTVYENGKECSKHCIDRNGTDHSFLNWQMFETLQSEIKAIPAIDISNNISSCILYVCNNESKAEKKEWKSYEGNIAFPKLKNKIGIEILKFMFGNPYLALTKGVFISQNHLAARLECKQYEVSRAFTNLKKLGLIEICQNYVIGKKAYCYKPSGMALEACKNIYRDKCGKVWSEGPGGISGEPEAILNGCWNEELLKRTRYFSNPEDWISYVQSIPNSDKKDRMDKAISIWNCHARNNGYEEIF